MSQKEEKRQIKREGREKRMKPKENSERSWEARGKGEERKQTKTGKKGMRARKMQGSFFNELELHPSFTFKSIV